MPEELTTQGTSPAPSGQPAALEAQGASPALPAGTADRVGQPEGAKPAQTTAPSEAGTAQAAEDSFFDPRQLPPELMPAYKQMQAAWSKKTEGLKTHRQKIEAFDAFQANPVGAMQALAQRMGFQVVPMGQQPQQPQHAGQGDQPWEPKSWEEVLQRAAQMGEERALQRARQEMAPVLTQVQQTQKVNIERMLDDAAPDWRQYEDQMVSLLTQHPSLGRDPVTLYRMAVPPEVLESRATQAALKKLQGKVDAAQAAGASTTNQTVSSKTPQFGSVREAAEWAAQHLQSQGVKPPPGMRVF